MNEKNYLWYRLHFLNSQNIIKRKKHKHHPNKRKSRGVYNSWANSKPCWVFLSLITARSCAQLNRCLLEYYAWFKNSWWKMKNCVTRNFYEIEYKMTNWLIDWLIDLNLERLLKLFIQDFFLNWVILLKLFREISSSDIPQRIFTEREITVTWMQLNFQITQSFFLGIVVKKIWISWRLCVVIKKYMEIRQRTRVQV